MMPWTLNYYDVTEAESEWLVGTDDPYSHKERRSYEARGESGFHAVWLTNEVIAAVVGDVEVRRYGVREQSPPPGCGESDPSKMIPGELAGRNRNHPSFPFRFPPRPKYSHFSHIEEVLMMVFNDDRVIENFAMTDLR